MVNAFKLVKFVITSFYLRGLPRLAVLSLLISFYIFKNARKTVQRQISDQNLGKAIVASEVAGAFDEGPDELLGEPLGETEALGDGT